MTSSSSVSNGVHDYSKLHDEEETSVEERTSSYKALVNAYYDLATVFYEWGWCSSFHFSYQFPHETFYESIRRHEYLLASCLGSGIFGSKHHILDVGCGIGGPMRNIAKFLQCQITGITINPYQVQRGNELSQQDPATKDLCKSIQGDFMNLPFGKNNSKDEEESFLFDAAYAIEATCHAPNRVQCYSQIYNCIKPGCIFACYEWCMTDKYDPTNPNHLRMKKQIEQGNGLPDIVTTQVCLEAMKDAGFEIVTEYDLATVPHVQSWMTPLMPSWNPLSQRFQFNWFGSIVTNIVIYAMELLYIAPAGTVKTQQILQTGGFALRDAGQEGIFTTMYLMVGRKPLVVV